MPVYPPKINALIVCQRRMMKLEPKEITCHHCGDSTMIERNRDWCEKCGRRIFYDPKDLKRHQWMTYYMYAVIIGVLGTGFILIRRFWDAFQ